MISSDIYHHESQETMSDILVRDLPEEIVAAIDAAARRMGLSRNEYVRRALARSVTPEVPMTIDDLKRFSLTFRDLVDADVMEAAWS